MAKVCPNCGHSNSDARETCKECRQSLSGVKVAYTPSEGKPWGCIGGVVVFGIVLFLFANMFSGGGRGTTARPSSSSSNAQRLPAPAQTHSFEGSNTRSTDDFRATYSPLIIDATNSGASNFIVELKGDDGARDELVVNEIGSFRGMLAVPVAIGETYHFDVDSEGRWTLKVRDVSSIGIMNESGSYNLSGRGSSVTRAFALDSGRVNFEFDHDGESNFIVYAYGVGSDDQILLVNEIGRLSNHSFSDRAADALYFLSIEADGEWTVKVSQ